MNKYIKTYENFEFNPGDFLDDFGIDVITSAKVKNAVEEVKKTSNSTFSELLSDASEYKDTVDTDGDHVVEVYCHSKYHITNYENTHKRIRQLFEKGIRPYLNVQWVFTFKAVSPEGVPSKGFGVSCNARAICTHPLKNYSKTYYADFAKARSIDPDEAIRKHITSVNFQLHSPTYPTSQALGGRELLVDFLKTTA